MFKSIIIILTLLACCYCLENNVPEEGRAKKKKGSLRILAIAALVVLAKIVVAKVATFVFLVAFFQKLFYIGGIFLNYYLKNQTPPAPQIMYGTPQEYNTVGYSYDPPDHEPFQSPELPSIADFSNGVKWLFNKQH